MGHAHSLLLLAVCCLVCLSGITPVPYLWWARPSSTLVAAAAAGASGSTTLQQPQTTMLVTLACNVGWAGLALLACLARPACAAFSLHRHTDRMHSIGMTCGRCGVVVLGLALGAGPLCFVAVACFIQLREQPIGRDDQVEVEIRQTHRSIYGQTAVFFGLSGCAKCNFQGTEW